MSHFNSSGWQSGKLLHQENIRTLEGKENYNYLEILKVDVIKQRWKKKITKEYLRKNKNISRNQMLNIDPWASRQSEILCSGRACENMRKQSRGWTEMCRCYEMIYEMLSWDMDKFQSWTSSGSASEWLGAPLRQRLTAYLRLSSPPTEKQKC